MLQFIMDRNVLLYVLTAACLVGVASQVILRQIYESLIKDTINVSEPDGRFLQQLRQRFQYCTHLNEKVGNVQALIQKNLIEYRFWGMSLHRWKRIGGFCLVIVALCAAGGSYFAWNNTGEIVSGNWYLWLGALAAVLIGAAYGISDSGYERQCLEIRLADYLENSGAAKNCSEAAETENAADRVMPMMASQTGRKERRRAARAERAAAQSRAEREKRELKENLSRIRAGAQESAADHEHQRNVELLRQMDPREQERILREVLKEVLA